ncbi:MAG: dihydroorotase [bacterium]|nr:dihydroorotase [bacterium]
MFDLLITNGTIVNYDGTNKGDIGIKDGKIADIGALAGQKADKTLDANSLHVLPGVIDTQVHFREPGLTHKEDLESGSRAAVKGGVTAVFEMPNTSPSTTTIEAIADKVDHGRNRMFCDFAFYAGASTDNLDRLAELERAPGVCGIKVFMGSSTGNLLVAESAELEQLFKTIRRRAAFHSEDEERLQQRLGKQVMGDASSHAVWRDKDTALNSTKRLLKLARKHAKRIHVLHITTADEMALLADYKDLVSVEVLPQHLTLSAPEAYERLGSLAQMNPPIRSQQHQDGLWDGLRVGTVDVIGSDHAPHTLEEKQKAYPSSPAGLPGVQTLVPLMLDHVNKGRLSLQRFVDLTSHGPNRLFGLADKGRLAKGYDADITLVDMSASRTITNEQQESRCGWTPFDGMKVTGWPVGTIVRGHQVMRDEEIITPAIGQPVRFQETIAPITS